MNIQIEISQLVNTLRKASDAYYNSGESIMTDAEYDGFEQRLKELDPTNEYFLGIGSTVRGEKVKLPLRCHH
ncbi:MAG: hypothetical protein HC836_31260 [Richelia sp. RM2_1_2]|nr:hypothetical protein [Richelia sp. RM2_1_2]